MENYEDETLDVANDLENTEQEESQEGVLHLPIGLKVGGQDILTMEVAETGAEAEKIYTKRPKQGKVSSWMGQVIAVSVSEIGGTPIASEFIKQTDKNIIPELVKQIPFYDAGGLLMQIQRQCWEDVLPNQKVHCTNCGEKLTVDVEIDKIKVPINETGEAITSYVVSLKKPYTIKTGLEPLKDFEGYKINRIRFRVPTLGDAIRHDGVSKDDVLFWRQLAFDTILDVYEEDDNNEITEVPKGFINRIGQALFTKYLTSKQLIEIRRGMQNALPTAKSYYEEECPKCSEMTPFFAQVSSFFQA